MTKNLKLTKQKIALVDDEDFERANKWKWCVRDTEYAVRRGKNGERIYLHRFIMECPENMVVHHKNHDTFDNRKSNLVVCSWQENCQSQKIQKRKKISRFKGVTFDEDKCKWRAYISGKFIGRFSSEEQAAMAYDSAAEEMFGDFAFPNRAQIT